MTDELVEMAEDTSTSDLEQMATSLRQVIRDDSETALDALVTTASQKPGLIARIKPTAVEKENQKMARAYIRQVATNKLEALQLYDSIRLEIARRQGATLIAVADLASQTALQAFAAEKLSEMNATLRASRSEFQASYGPQKEEIEQMREDHPEYYERAWASFQKTLDTYFDTMDALLEGFTNALKAKVPELGKH